VAGLGHNAIGLRQETEVPHLYSVYSFLPADSVIMVYINQVSLSGFSGLEVAKFAVCNRPKPSEF